MYHYQAKEKGSWLNVAKRKTSKITHGEAQALEGHSVSTRMLSSHRYNHHPLPCGLNSNPSPYQEVALPLTTGQKELWASLFNDKKAINTADLQIFFLNNDEKGNKETLWEEREVGFKSSRTSKEKKKRSW